MSPGSKVTKGFAPASAGSAAKARRAFAADAKQKKSVPRPEAELRFEQAMVGFFMKGADALGMPRSIAGIYGVIFASPQPLCFADIEARLEISKGSISQGLRVLREAGAILVVSAQKPASGISSAPNALPMTPAPDAWRRDYYKPDMELRKLVLRLIKEKLEPQLSRSGQTLGSLAQAIPFTHKAEIKEIKVRLKCLQQWHRKTSDLLPLLKTMLALGMG